MKECYLCGNTKFNKRLGSVRDNQELDVLECVSCGLVFLSSFAHIKNGFYERSEMHDRDKLSTKYWFTETIWNDERRFQYLRSVLSHCKLLDFGCGVGGFIMKAKELAAIVHGIESESRLRSYYQNHNLTVFQNIAEIPNDSCLQGYDIITMFSVLEHIADPKVLLGDLSKLLSDDGQIVIEVPNADDVLLTLYQCEPFSRFIYWSPHLFLYTAKTLQLLFDQMNLKVNYIKQIQRYSLANHLYWLANGKPDGHKKWYFLDSPEMHAAYEKQLASIGKCDTLIASISKY